MAARSINANQLAVWRRTAIGAIAFAWMPICVLNASGAESATYIDENGPSAAVDIAIALSSDDESEELAVDAATYNQQSTPSDEESTFDENLIAQQPAPPAEEVAPSEQLDDAQSTRRMLRPITQVTANAALPPGLLPEQVGRDANDIELAAEMPEVGDPRFAGGWGDSAFQWSATKLCHGPLYFEEVNLERYGYQCHGAVQPLVSGAHFFLTVPTLPYQMTVHPPRECIYTLGHYRPGSRVPWQRHRLPWDARAAAVQAGVTVGLIFLIP
jgi:hypothetical protein